MRQDALNHSKYETNTTVLVFCNCSSMWRMQVRLTSSPTNNNINIAGYVTLSPTNLAYSPAVAPANLLNHNLPTPHTMTYLLSLQAKQLFVAFMTWEAKPAISSYCLPLSSTCRCSIEKVATNNFLTFLHLTFQISVENNTGSLTRSLYHPRSKEKQTIIFPAYTDLNATLLKFTIISYGEQMHVYCITVGRGFFLKK